MLRFPILPTPRTRSAIWRAFPGLEQDWAAMNRELNPKHDVVIDSLLQTLHTLKLTLNMLPPNNERTYWTHVGDDALYAEAIAPFLYHRAHEIIYLIQRRRFENIEDHLAVMDPLPDPESWAKQIGEDIKRSQSEHRTLESHAIKLGVNYATESDIKRMSLQFEAIAPFVPVSWPGYGKWNHGIIRMNEYYGNLFSPSSDAPYILRHWRTHSQTQIALFESWTYLSHEMSRARAQSNALSAQAAKNRTLLINSGIPKPNLSSIIAWHALCGIEVNIISPPDLTYICFTHPHMPVTTEHGRGSGAMAMQDESSNSSHSLPARSGGHVRTQGGRIIHGRHEMWGIVYDANETIHDMSIWVSDSLMTRPAALMRRAFTKLQATSSKDFWGMGNHSITLPLPDPWVTADVNLTADWAHDYPISTTFRSMAKSVNHHFMFSDDPEGANALGEWRDAYLSAFKDYMLIREGWMPDFDLSSGIVVTMNRKTPAEALYAYGTLLSIQLNDMVGAKYTTGTAKGKRVAFDFGDLNLPE